MNIIGQNVTFKIEVEESPLSILLTFDRPMDSAIVPWEDAFNLAVLMEQVTQQVASEFMVAYPIVPRSTVVREQAQIRMSHSKGLVAILCDWGDRVRFTSLEAFSLVSRALRQKSQDAQYEQEKGVRFVYGRDGHLKQIQHKNGGKQLVR